MKLIIFLRMEQYIINHLKTVKKQIQKQTRNPGGDLRRENMKCFLNMKKTVL